MSALAKYLPKFLEFIEEHQLFDPSESVLLAVSGGSDSILMTHFFKEASFKFGIAHCNFSLRAEEADDDELFVKALAERMNVPFHTQKFDTHDFAAKNKVSTQMAARELRYAWFEKLQNQHGYAYTATAHHQSDVVETVLINLVRGTGIAGLHGILPKRNNLIRPLLFLTREEINSIINGDKIDFREDSSNLSSKYLRNKLRHEVIPILKEINPELENAFMTTVENIRASETLLELYLQEKKSELFTIHDKEIHISIEKLSNYPAPNQLLFELLKPCGFIPTQADEIMQALSGQSGKQFFSPTHKLIKDRKQLILSTIEEHEEELNFENLFNVREDENKSFGIPFSKTVGCFDLNKLNFPLKVRYWQPGDVFIPLGLARKKKLSDFLIDLKLSRNEKEKVKVVLSGDDIIWVAGYRISDKFKITEETKKIYILEFKHPI